MPGHGIKDGIPDQSAPLVVNDRAVKTERRRHQILRAAGGHVGGGTEQQQQQQRWARRRARDKEKQGEGRMSNEGSPAGISTWRMLVRSGVSFRRVSFRIRSRSVESYLAKCVSSS